MIRAFARGEACSASRPSYLPAICRAVTNSSSKKSSSVGSEEPLVGVWSRASFLGAPAVRIRITLLELGFHHHGALRIEKGLPGTLRLVWREPHFGAVDCDSVFSVASEMRLPSPPFGVSGSTHRASPDGFCSVDTTRRQEPRCWSRTSSFVKERATKPGRFETPSRVT